jgi:hypothetical protein
MKVISEGIPVVSLSPISSDRDCSGSAGLAEVLLESGWLPEQVATGESFENRHGVKPGTA